MLDVNEWCTAYKTDLYIERTALQQSLDAWLADPAPDKLLLTLVGSPGVGKSWLLRHLFEQESSRRPAMQLHAMDFLDDQTNLKLKLIDLARDHCSSLKFTRDPSPDLAQIIEGTVEALHHHCPHVTPLIIVDGCDQIHSPQKYDYLQREYFLRFLTAGNFRMVVALRGKVDDFRLEGYTQLLSVEMFDDPTNSDRQVAKLMARFDPTAVRWDYRRFLPSVCSYHWLHPYVNCLLLQRAFYVRGKQQLTSDDLQICSMYALNRVTSLPRKAFKPLTPNECETITQWAVALPDQWDLTQFKELSQRTSDQLQELQERGIVVNLQKPEEEFASPFYEIAAGLRELLRDIDAVRKQEHLA